MQHLRSLQVCQSVRAGLPSSSGLSIPAARVRERGSDRSRADHVDPDCAVLQLHGPCPGERANSRLAGTIQARARHAFLACNRSVEDYRATVRHQRQRLLDGGQDASDVDAERRVRVVHRCGRDVFRRAGRSPRTDEQDIYSTCFVLYLGANPGSALSANRYRCWPQSARRNVAPPINLPKHTAALIRPMRSQSFSAFTGRPWRHVLFQGLGNEKLIWRSV